MANERLGAQHHCPVQDSSAVDVLWKADGCIEGLGPHHAPREDDLRAHPYNEILVCHRLALSVGWGGIEGDNGRVRSFHSGIFIGSKPRREPVLKGSKPPSRLSVGN